MKGEHAGAFAVSILLLLIVMVVTWMMLWLLRRLIVTLMFIIFAAVCLAAILAGEWILENVLPLEALVQGSVGSAPVLFVAVFGQVVLKEVSSEVHLCLQRRTVCRSGAAFVHSVRTVAGGEQR